MAATLCPLQEPEIAEINCTSACASLSEAIKNLPNDTNMTFYNLTNHFGCGSQEYYRNDFKTIGTLFQTFIFLVGVIGNILVCTVVIKTRSMRTTTNCYLVSLAVADTITLIISVPQEVLSYHILGDQWVWGSVGCTLMIYLQVRNTA